MEIIRGTVAKSLAGHDKGSWYVVLSVNGKNALVANGKSRTICHPKTKNLIHLAPTKTVLSNEQMDRDESIRLYLKRFGLQPSEGELNV